MLTAALETRAAPRFSSKNPAQTGRAFAIMAAGARHGPLAAGHAASHRVRNDKEEKQMGIVKEFKEFAVKGNVMDLAIGVIIGGAFSTIVNSIVKDLIMPIVGVATGGLDFSNKFIRLGDIPPSFKGNPDSFKDLQTAGVAVFGYGSFITVLINFLILAIIVFAMVKFINKLRKPAEEAPAAPAPTPEDILLLREIRDALKR
jgi:large conductance mechanosensitive channel